MNKKKLLGVALSAALAFSFSASPANAEAIVLEGTCVLTLPDRVVSVVSEDDEYNRGLLDSNYVVKTTFLTGDMLVCPSGVTADLNWNGLFLTPVGPGWEMRAFSSSSPNSEARFTWREIPLIDATTKEISYKRGWTIEGNSAIYDRLQSPGYAEKPYIRATDDKFYEVKLAKPFELIDGSFVSTSTCVITVPDTKRYYSDPDDEKNYGYFPASNLKCPAEVSGHRISLNIELVNETGRNNYSESVWANCSISKKLDAASGLEYYPNSGLCVEANAIGTVTRTTKWSFVKDEETGIEYPVVLAAPYKSKYATDVTAKVKKKGSTLTIKINADRNQSLWNGRDTYKRQTVLVREKADRAIVKRGNKVIATVKLSIYGNGTVKIKDIAGKNNYTVTLVETDDNHAGVASFKK
jgi:hypothetical protein